MMSAYSDIYVCLYVYVYIYKGKVHPRTSHGGPEGGQMNSSTLPSTSALDGGGRLMPHSGCFTPGKDPVPIA